MKTIEEIWNETPLSLTSTDNPIFEVLEDVLVFDTNNEKSYCIAAGTKLRLVNPSCNLTEPFYAKDKDGNEYFEDNPSSVYRFGENKNIKVPNSIVKYVGGGQLGVKIDEKNFNVGETLLAILFMLFFGIGCNADNTLNSNADVILCPQVQQYMTVQQCSLEVARIDSLLCINQTLPIKGRYLEKVYMNMNAYHYEYNIAGNSSVNCDFKFICYPGLEQKYDSIKLVRWIDHDICNAIYIVDRVEPLNADKSRFYLKQIRETYANTYNNFGVCDGGGSPSQPNFFVRFDKCPEYANVGDSFGLKGIPKI